MRYYHLLAAGAITTVVVCIYVVWLVKTLVDLSEMRVPVDSDDGFFDFTDEQGRGCNAEEKQA